MATMQLVRIRKQHVIKLDGRSFLYFIYIMTKWWPPKFYSSYRSTLDRDYFRN